MNMKDHCYYRRGSESTRKMEHFEVADMFGRRPQPRLRLYGECFKPQQTHPELRLRVGMKNEGRGLARYPMARVGVAQGPEFKAANLNTWEEFKDGPEHVLRAQPGVVVHSGDRQVLFRLTQRLTSDMLRSEEDVVAVEVRLFADGLPPTTRSLRLSGVFLGQHYTAERDQGGPTLFFEEDEEGQSWTIEEPE